MSETRPLLHSPRRREALTIESKVRDLRTGLQLSVDSFEGEPNGVECLTANLQFGLFLLFLISAASSCSCGGLFSRASGRG